jgi:CheY-like chemotaxis protein
MGSPGRAFTILVVEDHSVIALEIEDAVRRNGGRVLGPAVRVSEALALINTSPCDAALLDIKLGHGETVYAVAERLHAKRIPFAFVTGWDRDIAEPYGDAPVLRKPFGEAELDNCLWALIGTMPQPVDQREGAECTESRHS